MTEVIAGGTARELRTATRGAEERGEVVAMRGPRQRLCGGAGLAAETLCSELVAVVSRGLVGVGSRQCRVGKGEAE